MVQTRRGEALKRGLGCPCLPKACPLPGALGSCRGPKWAPALMLEQKIG